MIRLRIREPNKPDREVTHPTNELVIGRVNADVIIDDRSISSSHAKILAGVVLSDLGSLNGVYVDGERLDQPVLGKGKTFILGGDPKTSTQIEILEATLGESVDTSKLIGENADLRKRIADLERDLAEAKSRGSGTRPGTPVPAPAPAPMAAPAPAPEPPPPAPTPPAKPKTPGGIPSFDEFFSPYIADVGEAPPTPATPGQPQAPAPVQRGGNRAAVLAMIDRLIKEDVRDRPLMEGPVEEFFTMENFRLLRQVEKVVTRMARDFVQLYEMKTMLPGSGGNLRSLAANVLMQPDNRHCREELVKYFEQLCRWLGVSLAANRHSALRLVETLKTELSAEGLTKRKSLPVLPKSLGLGGLELWKRSQRHMQGLTHQVVEDRLEGYIRDYAEENMDRGRE